MMENNKLDVNNEEKSIAHPAEHDYEKHKKNPGPSPSALNEEDDKGVGFTLIWIIAIMFILLLIVWFFFFRDVP
ncbi:hypothetical protein [Daejeonella sp.]|uniref:hypothetical protein n=1 Tax=Daejeonella sp. TaxID=2805397 RepID=UPI0025C3D4C4|nr:hypothetical protein [Daejeonella sp.]